jgi:glycine cleavage system H protein
MDSRISFQTSLSRRITKLAGGDQGMDKEKNDYQLIPNKDLRCVWMTAGMLSYKLCKYDFQCEKCPLDWELRNLSITSSSDSTASQREKNMVSPEVSPALIGKKRRVGEDLSGEESSLYNIKEFLFYHPGHTWIKVEKADEVRVGLDSFLGKMIGKVKVAVLPLSGRRCLVGEHLCSIILEEGILHIGVPVSGLVLSVNQKLKDHPELINEDPLGDGFLLALKPKNFQRDQKYLFFGETALSWYQKEWERFKGAVLSEAYLGQARLGMTMQDGEIRFRDIKESIAPERYIQLVRTFLREGEELFPRPKYKKGDHSKFQLGS